MTEESKVQKAINVIEKRPGIRSADLSNAIGIDNKQLAAMMATPVKRGFVVTSLIKRPSQPDTTEWRLSAAVTAGDWEQWKREARASDHKPLKSVAVPRRLVAPQQEISPRRLAAPQQETSTPTLEAQISALQRNRQADADAAQLAKRRIEELEREKTALADDKDSLQRSVSGFVAWLADQLQPLEFSPTNLADARTQLSAWLAENKHRIEQLEIAVDAAQMQLKQAGADIKTPVEAAIGYLVRTPKRKPRLCIKPERAKEAAEASAKVHGRSDVLALVPIGTARGGKAVNVEWKEA